MEQRKVLNLQLYYLPFMTAAALFFHWVLYLSVPTVFIVFCITVPALFGAFAIGIVSDRMKFWTYNVPDRLKIRNSSSHLMALWYTSTLGFTLVLLSGALLVKTDLVSIIVFSISFTVVYCLLGTFLDVLNVDTELLIVRNKAAKKNLGTVRIVFSYGPYYFSALGFSFSVIIKAGHYILVERGLSSYLLLLIVIGAVVLALPFLAYFAYLYNQIVKHRQSKVEPPQNK
jgi:hypothetical protein